MQPLPLKEVYSIWPTSFWQTSLGYGILFIIFVTIVLFCIVAFYWFWIVLNRFPKPLITKLKLMLRRNYSDKYAINNAYAELTHVLKLYIKNLYPVESSGITDWQLLEIFEQKGYNKEICHRLHELIKNAQASKFAHYELPEMKLKNDIMFTISVLNLQQGSRSKTL